MSTNIKVYLVGHPGSQHIVKASRYLTSKYMPGFKVTYINYAGDLKEWGLFLAEYFSLLKDKYIIFALDDYLLSAPIDMESYEDCLDQITSDDTVGCIKLCETTSEEHAEYPVTTQYCIWDREYLTYLLRQITNPWSFEIDGSRLFKKRSLYSLSPPLLYPTNSSLSKRWEGVRTDGNNPEDINFLKQNGYI